MPIVSEESAKAKHLKKLPRIPLDHQRFVDLFIANGGNATGAALAIWPEITYNTASQRGCRLLKRPGIRERLAQHEETALRAVGLQRDEILERLSRQATADYDDVIDIHDDGSFQFNLKRAKERGATQLIKKLRHDAETGAPIVELYDSQQALQTLAKIRGLVPADDMTAGRRRSPAGSGNRTLILNVLERSPEAARLLDQLAGHLHTQAPNDDVVIPASVKTVAPVTPSSDTQ